MKRSFLALLAALTVLSAARVYAGEAICEQCHPWGYLWHKHQMNKNPNRVEEKKLNRFWRDYYDSLGRYYGNMSHIDWVTFYKNHGTQLAPVNPYNCNQPVQYAPVIFAPNAQWAVPPGPPCAPQPEFGAPQ